MVLPCLLYTSSSEDGTAEGDKTPVSGYAFTPADGTLQALADTELKMCIRDRHNGSRDLGYYERYDFP